MMTKELFCLKYLRAQGFNCSTNRVPVDLFIRLHESYLELHHDEEVMALIIALYQNNIEITMRGEMYHNKKHKRIKGFLLDLVLKERYRGVFNTITQKVCVLK